MQGISGTQIKEVLHSKNSLEKFNSLENNKKGHILLHLPKSKRTTILSNLSNEELLKILKHLDPDKITDLLQSLSEHRSKKIIDLLSKSLKDKVEFLLKFNPKTAAGMMSLDYIEVQKKNKFSQVSELIKKHEQRTGKIPEILVVENGLLLGEVKIHQLALVKKTENISKHITHISSIHYSSNRDEVITQFRHNPHNKFVVLGDEGEVLGIIYSDDVLRVMHKTSVKHLGDFAGVNEEEEVIDGPLTKVKFRYKWLIVNIFTTFLAAGVISLFEGTIASFTLLAVYMPIVAGMGGNVGTQALAVAVRGIALKELDWSNGRKVIFNEMLAGIINGVITGTLIALLAIFWNQNVLIGVILGISIVVNLLIAGIFGSTIPLIMKSLGKDPATSATIFITTATDVFGFLVFLGLATIFLY
ncbi:MAG: magnesium transporter [Candidatus Nanoarchaeia archaeon]|nr:magnesium transporter [Candidatus Nanoarchaeia archaeon]